MVIWEPNHALLATEFKFWILVTITSNDFIDLLNFSQVVLRVLFNRLKYFLDLFQLIQSLILDRISPFEHLPSGDSFHHGLLEISHDFKLQPISTGSPTCTPACVITSQISSNEWFLFFIWFDLIWYFLAI
jgi:hypothetical protein